MVNCFDRNELIGEENGHNEYLYDERKNEFHMINQFILTYCYECFILNSVDVGFLFSIQLFVILNHLRY